MADQELKTKFAIAEKLVNENRVQVPENFKMKLYGLSKQAKEGDCRMPQPPESNALLRSKWAAWTECQGIPVDFAMEDYINIVDKLEANVKGSTMENIEVVSKKPLHTNSTHKRQGILYKQRDVMGGWRQRHFILQDNFLYYYLVQDNPNPRGKLNLSGCSISTEPSIVVDDEVYYPFLITLPDSDQHYRLAAETKLDADLWISDIIEASELNVTEPVQPFPPTKVSKTNDKATRENLSSTTSSTEWPEFYMTKIINPDETRADVPKPTLNRIEQMAKVVYDELQPNAAGWEILHDKPNKVVHRKVGTSVVQVKIESRLPFNIVDIFNIVVNPTRQAELDADQKQYDILKVFTNHSWIEYVQYSAILLTSPRDKLNIVHWRLLQDGSILCAKSSDHEHDHLRPVLEGNIRAEVFPSGFLLIPQKDGTLVRYLAHIDLSGSLPAAVVSYLTNSQADVLQRWLQVIEADKKKGLIKLALNHRATFEEYRQISCGLYESSDKEVITAIISKYKSISQAENGGISGFPDFYMTNVAHPIETRAFAPRPTMDKIERAAKIVYDELHQSAPNWELYSEKTNYVVRRKIGATATVHIKVETVLPFSVMDIASLLVNPKRQLELDPEKQRHSILKKYSNHTCVEYALFNSGWLTSPRDIINIFHWRLLDDGSVLIVLVSDPDYDYLHPIPDGHVRANLYPTGFLLRSTTNGTIIKYHKHYDLLSSVPSLMLGFTTQSQSETLLRLNTMLENDKRNGYTKYPVDHVTNYFELVMSCGSNLPLSVVVDQNTTTYPISTPTVTQTAVSSDSNKPKILVDSKISQSMTRSMRTNMLLLFFLLLPLLVYHFTRDDWYCWYVVPALILLDIMFLYRLHVGFPIAKTARRFIHKPSSGKLIFRFTVNAQKLILFAETKRSNNNSEVTFSHIIMKVCGKAIAEIPSLNGHVINNRFYPCKTTGVDMSLIVDVNEHSTAIVNIVDVANKSVDQISEELKERIRSIQYEENVANKRTSTSRSLLNQIYELFALLWNVMVQFQHDLGSKYGVEWKFLGIKAFPDGVCTVMTAPDGESDIDLFLTHSPAASTAPIVVTMGAARILPMIHTDGRMKGHSVFDFHISIDNNAATLSEAKKLMEQIRTFLNNPFALDLPDKSVPR